mmetsp:Transcript_96071/g.309877  ORF Transcript_96071/g.309877 Transcript_96071/m.309877 type:complete len:102 (+) Transcript_96071:956-1261(+)
MNAISAGAGKLISECSNQDLANIVWSYAALEYSAARPLLESISSASIARIEDFDQQHVSNTAWAIARLAWKDRPLFDALSGPAVPTISLFVAQGLSNMAWS